MHFKYIEIFSCVEGTEIWSNSRDDTQIWPNARGGGGAKTQILVSIKYFATGHMVRMWSYSCSCDVNGCCVSQ